MNTMNTIKINGIDYEFKYSFKALKELCKNEGIKLEQIEEFSTDFTNAPKIIYYGIGKGATIEEIESEIDNHNFQFVVDIIKQFGESVSQYFNVLPNE